METSSPNRPALSIDFATRAKPAEQAPLAFRMLIVGDFGRKRPEDSPVGLTVRGEAPASLPEQFEVMIECSVENLLGSDPPHLDIQLPVRRLSDFTDKALSANIEPLRRAAALRQAVAAGYAQLDSFADLDKLVAAMHERPLPAAVVPWGDDRPAPGDANLLQSILDGGPPSTARATGSGGLSSLIGSIARSAQPATAPHSLKEKLAALDTAVAQQLTAIREHPRFAAIEAVWRGLQLLLRNRSPDIQLDLIDVPAKDAARCLLSQVVPDELERMDGAPLNCVLVLGATANDIEGIERLAYCAAAGSALHVPVLASLRQEFFADAGDDAASAWTLLRSDSHAQWLAVCVGDLVLDAAERNAPLWGEPGWAVAALVLSSIARTGWPTDLADPAAAAIAGLDLHEVSARGGATMWPLRQPQGADAVAQLRALGVVALAARPNRDHVFLPAAPIAVAADGAEAVLLSDRLLVSILMARLREATLVVSGASDAGWAEAIRSVLAALLSAPNGLRGLRVDPYPRDPSSSARGFKIEMVTELPGLAGRRVAFDYWT